MGKIQHKEKVKSGKVKTVKIHKKKESQKRSKKGSGSGPPKVSKGQRKSQNRHKWSDARLVKIKKHIKDMEGELEEEENESVVETIPKPTLKSAPNAKPKKSVPQPELPKESLRERMMKRLEVARFRQINEELDSTTTASSSKEAFQSDPELFKKYHDAYKKRVEHWPKNPLETMIKWVKKKVGKDKIIADFGCGEARLAECVPNKVHSFDLFALNERVTACDMSNVPLKDEEVDVAIFCLSLMGTDVSKFVGEANRVLKINGILKIAEVSSRFSGNIHSNFLKRIKKFGFVAKQTGQGQSQKGNNNKGQEEDNVFIMLEFRKVKSIKGLQGVGRLPALKLSPSVYKKR